MNNLLRPVASCRKMEQPFLLPSIFELTMLDVTGWTGGAIVRCRQNPVENSRAGQLKQSHCRCTERSGCFRKPLRFSVFRHYSPKCPAHIPQSCWEKQLKSRHEVSVNQQIFRGIWQQRIRLRRMGAMTAAGVAKTVALPATPSLAPLRDCHQGCW